jgi:hypothetical protein
LWQLVEKPNKAAEMFVVCGPCGGCVGYFSDARAVAKIANLSYFVVNYFLVQF